MRIEILIENEEPRIYPLNRQKLIVGSLDTCDIVVKHKGISRKHIIITTSDDKIFVSDQGSTNGTYINEQRLIPGRTTEMTSFFPVRLGDDVLITLLSDDEAQDLGPETNLNTTERTSPGTDFSESTKMISLTHLQKSSTANLVRKRTETVAQRKKQQLRKKAPPKKEAGLSNAFVGIMCLIAIVGATYYQFTKNKETEVRGSVPQQVEQKPVTTPVAEGTIKRVELEKVPVSEPILAAFSRPKCSQEVEKYLCATLPTIFQGTWGTVLLDKNIVIMVDGNSFTTGSNFYLKEGPSPEQNASDLSLMRVVLWVNETIPPELLKFNGLDDYTITVAFIDNSKEAPVFLSGAVFVPESLLRLKQKIRPIHFEETRKNGVAEFSYALDYLRFM